jgi:DNA-binding IclR family transcriptional regulator
MEEQVISPAEHGPPADQGLGIRPAGVASQPDAGPMTLGRALLILEGFADRADWGVRELSRALEISPSTASHLLTGLERLGVLERTPARRYRLAWRAGVLGTVLAAGFRPGEVAEPVVAGLAARTGETAHLATLAGDDVVYLVKVEGRHAVRIASRLGQRFPAAVTACGKALLAHDPVAAERVLARPLTALTEHTITDPDALRAALADIRAGALARDVEEIELHAACAALPVLAPHGGAQYALSVSGPRDRIEGNLDEIGSSLSAAVADLAGRLHGSTGLGMAA